MQLHHIFTYTILQNLDNRLLTNQRKGLLKSLTTTKGGGLKCEPLKAAKPCGYPNNQSCFRSSSSWCLIYSLMTASSRPTVDTKYPFAHMCCPLKYIRRSPYTCASISRSSPCCTPTTYDTLYFGGILTLMCMWSTPVATFFQACSERTRHTPHNFARRRRGFFP